MFEFFEQLALSVVIALLQKVIKNPKTYAGIETVIQHIATDAATALAGLQNPVTPASPTQAA